VLFQPDFLALATLLLKVSSMTPSFSPMSMTAWCLFMKALKYIATVYFTNGIVFSLSIVPSLAVGLSVGT
jgi:hypothetical protein